LGGYDYWLTPGSVGGNRAFGKTCGRRQRDRQPLDLQPLQDLVAVAEQVLPKHAERIEHVDRRGNFVISLASSALPSAMRSCSWASAISSRPWSDRTSPVRRGLVYPILGAL